MTSISPTICVSASAAARDDGEGRHKRVYLAIDRHAGREVGLALIKAEAFDDLGEPRVWREFDAIARVSGHANTVAVETEAGTYDVDTGFVVLNDRNYPNLQRLFAELGVATQPSDMSFSVSDAAGRFE